MPEGPLGPSLTGPAPCLVPPPFIYPLKILVRGRHSLLGLVGRARCVCVRVCPCVYGADDRGQEEGGESVEAPTCQMRLGLLCGMGTDAGHGNGKPGGAGWE